MGAPATAEPAVAPAPPVAAPVEVANAQAPVRAAVDRTPEKDVASIPVFIFLPLLGDEVWVGQQVVKQNRVENVLALQLLAKLVALNRSAILGRVEVEGDFRRVPLKPATPLVILYLPAVGNNGVGVEVDEMLFHYELGASLYDIADAREKISTGQLFDLGVSKPIPLESVLEFTGLINIKYERVRHDVSLSTVQRVLNKRVAIS